MIISHTQRLIFIKTKKVGGTSLEIALSKYCGDECVITPIVREDEQFRQSLGFRGAQNYKNTYWREWGLRTNGEYYNHVSAPVVKATIPEQAWNGYQKFAIYRNPYDVAISRYFWEGGQSTGLDFEAYVAAYPQHLRENEQIAPLDGPARLDSYLRYENLRADLDRIGLGYLWDTFSQIRAKGHLRPKTGASMSEIYAAFPGAKAIIARECAAEIAFFDYGVPTAEANA